jgi:hypothetical protein
VTTLAQAHADLIANPRPVLFLDTCTLLDLVRATQRALSATVRAGGELRDLAKAGAVQLFVQDIVPREWNDNLAAARRDGEAGILAFTATWQIAIDLAQPAPAPPVLPPGALIDELERLSHDLLAMATVLDRDRDGMSWAIDRVAAKQKPSSAKGPVKDCHILGHALRLSTLLQHSHYPKSRVMVSSNRSDFAAPNAVVFHDDIVADATAAGLEYAVSLEAAVDLLRARGEIK